MRNKTKAYKPSFKKSVKSIGEDFRVRKQISKAEKTCISLINEFAKKDERKAYVYLTNWKIPKQESIRTDYVIINSMDEYIIENFLIENEFRVNKYHPAKYSDTPEKIKSIINEGPFHRLSEVYYNALKLWVIKF